jgi:hypothetical protein
VKRKQQRPRPIERPWRPEDGAAFADHLLLTTRQTAKWLGTTPGGLEIMRHRRLGPNFIRVGKRRIMYERSAVLQYLASRRVEMAPVA